MAAIFADDISKRIFMNKNCCISIRISLNFVRKGPIDNKSMLFQGPVLLTFLRHVARISANGIAAFKESCSPIG